MEYYTIDTSKKEYPLVLEEGGFFNKFNAGEELIKHINRFFPDVIHFTTISSRDGRGMREELLECYFDFPGSSKHTFFIYAIEIEGGGRSNLPYEQRLQIRQHDLWIPDLNTIRIANKFKNAQGNKDNVECYVIGIYKTGPNDDDVIFSGFYPNVMEDVELTATSPTSKQLSIEKIQEAYLRNISFQDKGYSNGLPFIIVNFKPQYIFWYMENRDQLHLNDIEEAKHIGNQIIGVPIKGINTIYYGAPGTGKSHQIDIDTGKKHRFRVTFHPDTDYASFIGCYKPVMDTNDEGKEEIKYDFSAQRFLDAYVAAWKNPLTNYYLIIEEINRGNCAQIFGDMFQLLDRDEDGYSSYIIQSDKDIKRYLTKELKNDQNASYIERLKQRYPEDIDNIDFGTMALPDNLSILATMNTSDQSLFPMDSAFKRRWNWEYIAIDYSDASKFWLKLDSDKDSVYNWDKVLHAINAFIIDNLDTADKTLGNRFVNPADKIIDFKMFRDKVLFFLFNDAFKDNNTLSEKFDGIKLFENIFEKSEHEQIIIAKKFVDEVLSVDVDYTTKCEEAKEDKFPELFAE